MLSILKPNYNRRTKKPTKLLKLVVLSVLIIGLASLVRVELFHHWDSKITSEAVDFKVPTRDLGSVKQKQIASSTTSSTSSANSPCSSNTLNQLILVSISQRHLWACDSSNVAYDSSVITGMSFLAADLTPTGTYHIYAKETDTHLIGHDSTGSWNDYVYYWMPFLDNQYGQYGFHDATWRQPTDFGNISPDSSNASHGCVECPLATAKWLYNWSVVGTTVTIES